MGKLSEKHALVTGGSRGIGRGIVNAFVAAGARVSTCGRGPRPPNLADAVSWHTVDVSNPAEVRALAEAVTAADDLHILVNNAGIQIEKTIVESTDDDWDQLMGANARGVFNCCRAFIPRMSASGGGSIINIGSISGRAADPSLALYNASKAFVHGLTRSIAVDHGADGIRCNAIAPGWIMTEMASAAFALASNPLAAEQDALARHAAGRFGQPADIANTAVWLASEDAAFATGQVFVIDGGLTAASPLQPGLY